MRGGSPRAAAGAGALHHLPEDDARRALLLQAFESAPLAPWNAEDAREIGEEARRVVGERGAPAQWLAVRARQGLARLAARDAHLAPVLDQVLTATTWPRGALTVALALGAIVGVGLDAVGATGRIHLLAPPLLGLLLWNLLVYALLAYQWLRSSRAVAPPAPGGDAGRTTAEPASPTGQARAGLLASAWTMAVEWFAVRPFVRRAASSLPASTRGPTVGALGRFAVAWGRASRPAWTARAAAGLHAAAAALALGAVASLYVRGLAFEYRAGWDSTFLGAEEARALLGVVLGPAAALSGLALPDATAFAALRFAAGPGENAARWIHLWALTLVLLVVLPRLALATLASWQARRLATSVPVPASMFDAADSADPARRAHAWVLPFGRPTRTAEGAALGTMLSRSLGAAVEVTIAEVTDEGDEDRVASQPVRGPAPTFAVALLPLGATPERETHGRFLDGLAARCARERWQLVVVLNEAGFASGLPSVDAQRRRTERQDAWRRLARGVGAEPLFANLSAGHATGETAPAAPPGVSGDHR